MEEKSSVNISSNIRENSEELQDYLRDLERWEIDMKKKDQEFLKMAKATVKEEEALPPIRNSCQPKRLNIPSAQEVKQTGESLVSKSTKNLTNKVACSDKTLGNEYNMNQLLKDEGVETDTSSDETDEELEIERKRQKANFEREQGNEFFKKGNYNEAITCYTSGMQDDPTNAIIPANRAMALLKLGQIAAAEKDCTLSISIDHTYIKAFHRRGTCRLALKKYQLARQDFLKVLEMNPNNKEARIELDKINEEFRKQDKKKENEEPLLIESKTTSKILPSKDSEIKTSNANNDGRIYPIQKDMESRSNKPLKRLNIVDLPKSKSKNEDITLAKTKVEVSNSKLVKEVVSTSVPAEVTQLIEPLSDLPSVPINAFQFERDWRFLRKWPKMQHQYLLNFPPENFATIFKNSIEVEIFISVLKVLGDNYKGDVQLYVKYLTNLSKVGRFSTIIMFLSDDEKKGIEKLLNAVIINCTSEEDKKYLKLLYKV